MGLNPQGEPLAVVTSRTMLGSLIAAGAMVGLVCTNPDPEEFERFAADRLTRLIRDELCSEDGLPIMLRLVIRDCPALVESQRTVLGRLARNHTRRRNFGLFSLYTTELGGQNLMPNWRLPSYGATTLAGAGRFLILKSEQTDASEVGP